MERLTDRLTQQVLRDFARIGRSASFARGQTVFHDGDPYRGPYMVSSGKFKICNVNEEGKEVIISIFGEGEWIAAPPVFADTPRYHAECIALEEGDLLLFPCAELRSYLLQHSEVMFEFARMIASTTLQFRERLRALTLLNVQQRLESFLSELGARKQAVALPLPKNQIASLIGSTPESVSRAFRILVDEGKLKVDGEKYHLEGSGGSKADAASA